MNHFNLWTCCRGQGWELNTPLCLHCHLLMQSRSQCRSFGPWWDHQSCISSWPNLTRVQGRESRIHLVPDPLSSRVTGPAAAYRWRHTDVWHVDTEQTKEVIWRHLHNSCDMTKWRVLPRSFNFPRGFFDLSNKLVPIRKTKTIAIKPRNLFKFGLDCTR